MRRSAESHAVSGAAMRAPALADPQPEEAAVPAMANETENAARAFFKRLRKDAR